jgi:small conductance mechanosensitive channel
MAKLLGLWIGLLTAFPTVDIELYGIKIVRIMLILVGLILAGRAGGQLINGLLRLDRIPGSWNERRVKTLRGLIRSLLRYALYFVGAIMVLSELNVNTSSILAGAGIIGLAVGFGAQNLVRDVVTGFFILFEDQFAIGDYVTIAGVTGTVEDMGMRVTKIRESSGILHIISNGAISEVTNMARGAMGALVEISVDGHQDLNRVTVTIETAIRMVADAHREIVVEEPRVLGVSGFSGGNVTLQVTAKVKPMQQWEFERQLRKAIKEALDGAGIALT